MTSRNAKYPALADKTPRRAIGLSSLSGLCCLLLPLLMPANSLAAVLDNPCASQSDERERLRCYDRLFATPEAQPAESSSAVSIPNPSVQHAEASAPARHPPLAVERSASLLSRFWEIDPEDKGEPFVVKTYLPNFLLPMHYSSNINRTPHSPTQAATLGPDNLRRTEAKLQISLRAKMADDLFLPGASLWFAYTQQSLWQVWDQADSSPFRSTDYQPEAIYILPVPARIGEFAGGWRLRLLQLGLAHQSNGQSDPLSRSWNRAYVGAGIEKGNFSIGLRYNHRFREKANDDNPDLTQYIGRSAISMNWLAGAYTSSLTWKTNLKNLDRGSLQFDLTHPVFSDHPNGLRWYLQMFSGYGETLLDYNQRQNRIGVGLSLFQF